MATFKSNHGEIDLSVNEGLSLSDYVQNSADKAPAGAVALHCGVTDRALEYTALRPTIRAMGSGLASFGLVKGEVLAILAPNLPEYAVAFHAVLSLGATVTTINPMYTSNEVAHQCEDAGAKYSLTVGVFLEKTYEAVTKLPGMRRVYVFDAADDGTKSPPLTSYCSLICNGDADFPSPPPQINPKEDVAVIPYSSGTSGLPKGVMLTHSNIIANIQQVSKEHVMLSGDDTLVGVLPFFHIYGMVVILNVALAQHAKVVTMPKFEPPLFLQILKKHSVTVAHVAPPLVGFLAKHPAVDQILPLPALQELLCGAAPLGSELSDLVKARLKIEYVRQGYGMTEMSPASHITHKRLIKPGSIGDLLPSTECKMVSTGDGSVVGVDARGELCIRGPQVMKGYLNNPEATAEAIDEDGFLHTGDVGIVDSDGCFTIVDRVKELIKVKGFQVAPAELEALLGGFPKVADAAVIGIADAKAGELPKAYIVKQKGSEDLTEDEVKDYVKGKVAEYKELGSVEFIDAVPKSAAGKILRKELRRMEESKK